MQTLLHRKMRNRYAFLPVQIAADNHSVQKEPPLYAQMIH